MTTSDIIEIFVAVGTIGLAGAAFWQLARERWTRPALTLEAEPRTERLHTRLEGSPPGTPWIRLMVRNARGRRTAHGTRVIVERYWQTHYGNQVSLAGPELGWPSTALPEGEGAVVFGGTSRPIDFGTLFRHPVREGDERKPSTFEWHFQFTLAMHGEGLLIGREILRPISGGYTARLVIGADEGLAQTFDVQFSWVGNVGNSEQALGSLLLEVKPVPADRRRWWWPPRRPRFRVRRA